jgi:hypothetical protein
MDDDCTPILGKLHILVFETLQVSKKDVFFFSKWVSWCLKIMGY